MKNKNFFIKLSTATLILCAGCNVSMAADAGSAYIGVGAGGSRFGYTSQQCTIDTGLSCTVSSSDTGAKIFAGYNISTNAAIEASVVDFGKLTGNAGTLNLEESETALSISLIGIAPISKDFSLSGKVGYFSANVDVKATGPGGTASTSDTARNFLIGVGAGYSFTPHIAGKLEFEHFIKAGDSETNIDLGTVSLAYNF